MGASQDTEITLGTGKLLGLFFALVIICSVFFGLGYSLGRGTGKPVAGDLLAIPESGAGGRGIKPTAVRNPGNSTADANSGSELTFYKAVEQNQPSATLEKPAEDAPKVESKPAPEMTRAAGGGYVVQIAAVSKQEDADALVSALRKKQYPVFSTATATDKLVHVQVGPFADLRQAEEMKQQLTGDGYNPIVKK